MLLPIMAGAQEAESDSVVVHELGEITIVADSQRTTATKTVYVPTSSQKSTSSGGVSLLSRMEIPQINVNPITESVRTADNQALALFINYHPATEEDVRGLNTEDVRRVEYMDFPIDPRFERSQHVINFITAPYQYGGYTKLTGKESFIVNRGDGSVYSKFSFRKMEYDFVVSSSYLKSRHLGTLTDETYKSDTVTVTRKSDTANGRMNSHSVYSAFRASWNKNDNFSFRNLINFKRVNTPVNQTTGLVDFSSIYSSEKFNTNSPMRNNSLGWESNLYCLLDKGWSINGSFQAEYNDNKTVSEYRRGKDTIYNSASEGQLWLHGVIQANKTLSDKIVLFSNITSGWGKTRIDYSGTSNTVNLFRQRFTGLTLGVSMNLNKFSGSIDGGLALESNMINGKGINDCYPFTHMNLQYSPNHKNSLNLWFQYASYSPNATMKNPNLIQQSELMYISGNSDLKNARNIVGNLSYTCLPNNMWQLTVYTTYFRISDRQIAVYSPDGPGGCILKKYQNDGDYNHGQIGARLTLKTMGGKFSFSASPRLLIYKTTGSHRNTYNSFTTSLSANYYLGNFFFNAFYNSRWGYIDGENAFLRKMPESYSVSAGWFKGDWNLQLSLINIFQSSWEISHDRLITRWYDSYITQYGNDYHRSITFSATYTFNYGKKVNRSGELSDDMNISSSILR